MNQLIEVKKGTTALNAVWVARFKYDPIGRRIEKATPVQVTTYTYDGADILRENVTISGSTVTSYYVHGPGIDEPLSKETGGVLTYYHADGLGSIAKETDGSGVVTNTLRYDAWGNIETGARDGFAFTGREWDPETGLYYYRARYYDPRDGRFTSEDSVGFAAGDANFYGYVSSRPTIARDPDGHFLNFAIGALTSVATGWLLAELTGDCYSWKDAAVDAATGAAFAGILSKANKAWRVLSLRNLAKARNLEAATVKGGYETFKSAAGGAERLVIKHVAGTSPGLQAGSLVPRFEYRIANGVFKDPFTGAVGPKGALSHVPLEPLLPRGAYGLAGLATGSIDSAARAADNSAACGCRN